MIIRKYPLPANNNHSHRKLFARSYPMISNSLAGIIPPIIRNRGTCHQYGKEEWL